MKEIQLQIFFILKATFNFISSSSFAAIAHENYSFGAPG